MIRISICDDEPIFCRQLEQAVTRTAKELELTVSVTCYTSGEKLLEEACPQANHLLFLDIEFNSAPEASRLHKSFVQMVITAQRSYLSRHIPLIPCVCLRYSR